MTQLMYLDVEATGTEDEDRLLQVAFATDDDLKGNELFKPPVKIKLPAMAVHHVTEAMVADKPAFKDSIMYKQLKSMVSSHILVAHNAKYDTGMLAKEGLVFDQVICTYKLAKYLDDGTMEAHNLQYLRYYYGVEVEAVAHDAFGDITVLEAVFAKLTEALIKKDFPTLIPVGTEVLERMVEISKLPSLIRVCNFKEYKGVPWEEVARLDISYLQWFIGQPELDEDLKFTLNYYLNK
jgi:exodeoxyribonuclease X